MNHNKLLIKYFYFFNSRVVLVSKLDLVCTLMRWKLKIPNAFLITGKNKQITIN